MRLAEIVERDAEHLGLVGEIVRDAGARKHDQADRQGFQELIVTFERCGFAVAGPVRLKDDLLAIAIVGPAGRNAFGAFWRSAMEEHHVVVLGADLVEGGPDGSSVVYLLSAGEGDLGAGRDERFELDLALGVEIVAAVDHRGGHVLAIDVAARARMPSLSEMGLEMVGREVAHAVIGVALFGERKPFGDEAFQFNRANFGPVLAALRAPLRLLVFVELAVDAGRHAVEDIGGGPEQVFQVGFEPRVAESDDEGVEDIRDRAFDGAGAWQGPRIGVVGKRSMSEELQFVEDEGCGGAGFGLVIGHGRCASLSLTAPRAAFMGDGKRDATGPAPTQLPTKWTFAGTPWLRRPKR